MPRCEGSLFRSSHARFFLFLGLAFTILVLSLISWRINGEPSSFSARGTRGSNIRQVPVIRYKVANQPPALEVRLYKTQFVLHASHY